MNSLKKVRMFEKNALDIMMFGFVNGVRNVVPNSSIKESIIMFEKHYGINEIDYPIESALVAYHRMAKDFIKS